MIRTPQVKVIIERWNWVAGGTACNIKDTLDITNSVLGYQFLKTVKRPGATANITVTPQRSAVNIMDDIFPNDVVKIYEFGALKFLGYIVTITFQGQIQGSGRPLRTGTIEASGFGALVASAQVGINLGNMQSTAAKFINESISLITSLSQQVLNDSATYGSILSTIFSDWYALLDNIQNGAQAFATYLNNYFDNSTAVDNVAAPGIPRQFNLFTGTELGLTVWDILLPVIQVPFNEIWIDNGSTDGSRNVQVEGSPVLLNDERAYLVMRPTPYDGRVSNNGATVSNDFSSLPLRTIDLGNIVSFNFSKSSRESLSLYNVVPAAFVFNDYVRALLGMLTPDPNNVNKYLSRILTSQLYFSRAVEVGSSTGDSQKLPDVEIATDDYNETLLNWFTFNDHFLSGTIQFNVPTKPAEDIFIGDRVAMPEIEGSFYVEGVGHSWQMMGPVLSTLSVTRGRQSWSSENGNVSMTLTNKIFRSGIPIEDQKA